MNHGSWCEYAISDYSSQDGNFFWLVQLLNETDLEDIKVIMEV